MELLGCIKENGFDALVVNDTDRLSRDSMSLLILSFGCVDTHIDIERLLTGD
jgi:DNA invertase Pin-like site-specific DNA recombinase